jgi:hypothetical protein
LSASFARLSHTPLYLNAVFLVRFNYTLVLDSRGGKKTWDPLRSPLDKLVTAILSRGKGKTLQTGFNLTFYC